MSPKVLKHGDLVFWFHSYDAISENRASIHVGKSSQNDASDAKIWLEPELEVAREGRTLSRLDLRKALRIIEDNWQPLLEAWYDYRNRG